MGPHDVASPPAQPLLAVGCGAMLVHAGGEEQVIAIVVSQDASALPTATCWRVTALVGCMGLLAVPDHGGSSSRAALLRLPLVLVIS